MGKGHETAGSFLRINGELGSQNKNQGGILTQACYSVTHSDTFKREVRALMAVSKELNVKDLFILTWDETEQNYDLEGFQIKMIPIWKVDLFDQFIRSKLP